jgi:mannose-P-dolichol utilization defect protein 1
MCQKIQSKTIQPHFTPHHSETNPNKKEHSPALHHKTTMVRFAKYQAMLLFATLLSFVLVNGSTQPFSNKASKTYKYLLWTPECYTTWFTDYDIFHLGCLKSIISRGLSFGIIVGSSILKVPQMYNFYKTKSTSGVSSAMLYLDVISFTPSPIYNMMMYHPFFTYGEQVIVLTENIILVLMLWYYNQNSTSKCLGISIMYSLIVFGFFHAPQSIWWTYPLLGAAAAVLGRIPQITENYANQYTGTLSAFTFILNSLGGVARMFTTMNSTGDLYIATSQFIGVIFSIIVLVQIIMYRKNKKSVKDSKGSV